MFYKKFYIREILYMYLFKVGNYIKFHSKKNSLKYSVFIQPVHVFNINNFITEDGIIAEA